MSELSEIVTGVVAKASGAGAQTDIPKLSRLTVHQIKNLLRKIAAGVKDETGAIEYGELIQKIEEL